MAPDDSTLRRALDAALAELEASGQLALHAPRADVLDFLCAGVGAVVSSPDDDAPDTDGGRVAFAVALEAAARDGFGHPAWRQAATRRYADAAVEEARRQAGLVQLRLAQGGVTAEQAAVYLRRLAEGMRAGDGTG
jgi:hypothetical protein